MVALRRAVDRRRLDDLEQQADPGRPVQRRVGSGGEDARDELPRGRGGIRDAAHHDQIGQGRRRRHEGSDRRHRRACQGRAGRQERAHAQRHRGPRLRRRPLGAGLVRDQGQRRGRRATDRAGRPPRSSRRRRPTRDLRIEQFGDASVGKATRQVVRATTSSKAETMSLPITLLILFIAFGALVAAGVPAAARRSPRWSPRSACSPISHVVPGRRPDQPILIPLIGLAVGVDYSLFYLRREREERAARPRRACRAIAIAAATSGRAILISGFTVMAAMAGHVPRRRHDRSPRYAIGTILVVARRDARLADRAAGDRCPCSGDHVDKGRIRIPFLRRRKPRAARVARLVVHPRPRAAAPGARRPSPRSRCCS